MLQAALRRERGIKRSTHRVECGAEGSADDSKDIVVMRFNRFVQNRVMPPWMKSYL
jgi:hypothetical protein